MKCIKCGNELDGNNYCKTCGKVYGKEIKNSEIIKFNITNNIFYFVASLVFFFVLVIELFIFIYYANVINSTIMGVIFVASFAIYFLALFFHLRGKNNKNHVINYKSINKEEECVVEDILYFYYREGMASNMIIGTLPDSDIVIRPIVRIKSDNSLVVVDTKSQIKRTDAGFIVNNKEYKIGDTIVVFIDSYVEDSEIIKNMKYYLEGKEYNTFSYLSYAYMGKWDKHESFSNTTVTKTLYNETFDNLEEKLLDTKLTGRKTNII